MANISENNDGLHLRAELEAGRADIEPRIEIISSSSMAGFYNANGELVWVKDWNPEDGEPEWAVDPKTLGVDLFDAFNRSLNAQRFGENHRCCFCGRELAQ